MSFNAIHGNKILTKISDYSIKPYLLSIGTFFFCKSHLLQIKGVSGMVEGNLIIVLSQIKRKHNNVTLF